ncbi:hypothetical protein O181_123081 [Austropuccinia psidii MF-1]|uniref:Uncharacterized protein n=1 Tax=Austropuccinia psidii MF-1 TaxID=1389203 RepID=A0A9Q3KMS2_9BASI|nr:hypothetical protein [Austropuccinia psidii MF-1]
MSDTISNMKILRECGGELEHAIKVICVEPCSTEDYINAMEDIITRTRIGKTWTRIPIESKMFQKIPREDKRPERPVLKCCKCGSTSHLATTCTKKTKTMKFRSLEEFSLLKRRRNLIKIMQSPRIHQWRTVPLKTLKRSLRSQKSIPTCHSTVRIAAT